MHRVLNKFSYQTKITSILVLVLVLPTIGELIVLEDYGLQILEACLVGHVCLSIILCCPLSSLIAEINFLYHVREMNKFFEDFRNGRELRDLNLPSEDQDELISLKRNLLYFSRIIGQRENLLQYRLNHIQEQYTQSQQLQDLDPLTGLYNRRYIEKLIPDIRNEQRDIYQGCFLMLIDCDGFKSVNDNYGHAEGDHILICLAGILKNCVRESTDFPFRIGGDEFGIILTGMDSTSAFKVVERIRYEFYLQNKMDISLSIGMMEWDNQLTWNDLYQGADYALYQAKTKGGNRIEIWRNS